MKFHLGGLKIFFKKSKKSRFFTFKDFVAKWHTNDKKWHTNDQKWHTNEKRDFSLLRVLYKNVYKCVFTHQKV